jgi:hypothetical protein
VSVCPGSKFGMGTPGMPVHGCGFRQSTTSLGSKPIGIVFSICKSGRTDGSVGNKFCPTGQPLVPLLASTMILNTPLLSTNTWRPDSNKGVGVGPKHWQCGTSQPMQPSPLAMPKYVTRGPGAFDVAVGVAVMVPVAVTVRVGLDVSVTVEVAVNVGVNDAVTVAVTVAVEVTVDVELAVLVDDGEVVAVVVPVAVAV